VTPEDDGPITSAPLSFVIKKESAHCDVLTTKPEEPEQIYSKHRSPRTAKSKLPKKQISCSICHKHLANRTTLQKHLRIHTGEKPYQCGYCQRRFRQKEHCEKHSRIHSQGNGHECLACTMTFGRRHFLEKHMLVCHNTDSRAQQSPATQVRQAPAVTSKLPNVPEGAPVKTSEPKTSSTCGVCGKVFRQRYNVKRHIRTQHRGAKNECKVCEKVFKSTSGLKNHELIHVGEKPFRCGLCCRCFTQKHHLIKHQLVHLPKVNIICSICRQGFRYASSFFKHMAVHEAKDEAEQKPPLAEEMICYGTPGATLHRSPFFQPQFVLFEPSDMKCMFCDVTLEGPDDLHDHLVDHCEQVLAESGDAPWESDADREILGL
ncbi:unnamed protein product, partial [Ixodes hexagonus]